MSIQVRIVRGNGRNYYSLADLQEEYKNKYVENISESIVYGVLKKGIFFEKIANIPSGTVLKLEKIAGSNSYLLSGKFKHLFLRMSHLTMLSILCEVQEENFPKNNHERDMWKMLYHADFKDP